MAKAAASSPEAAGTAAPARSIRWICTAVRVALSEEERLVQDSVARLVDAEVLPIIQHCFEEHRFPQELDSEARSAGAARLLDRGLRLRGLNAVCYGLICQELERGDSGMRSFVSVQSSLCMYPIYAFGSDEQKQHYLPRMARGELIGCFGLTEPHGGSDPANMKTHASGAAATGSERLEDVDHQWLDRRRRRGVGDDARWHPRLPRRQRNARVSRHRRSSDKFSLRASVTAALFFDNVVVPEEPTCCPGWWASRGRCRASRRRATASAGASSAPRRPASSSCSTTPRHGSSSAGRSPPIRPSRYASPRWPGASPPRSCWLCSSGG